MSDTGPEGFALRRNGTCLSSEEECGPTSSPFYACCPSGSTCSNPYNQVCCPTATNCTTAVVQEPACGDSDWNLFNNGGVEGGYFCCLSSSAGYAALDTDSSGCASEGYALVENEVSLQILDQAQASSVAATSSSTLMSSTLMSSTLMSSTSSSSSSSNPTSAAATASTTSTPESSSNGSSSTGAIGGGVAAAVAVILIVIIAFFIWRRRKHASRQKSSPNDPYNGAGQANKETYREILELAATPHVSELPAAADKKDRKSSAQPVELP